jgi:membrane protease YdiL (CAAX protease family)
VLLTLPLLAVITAIKWLLMRLHSQWSAESLIRYPDLAARLAEPEVIKLLSIYVVSSAVQELIVRGAFQSSLDMFLTGPGRTRKAILISALVFAAMHIHMSFLFAALAFVPGLFWGWLFARNPNLVGVTLSHAAVGGYVFFILGISLN